MKIRTLMAAAALIALVAGLGSTAHRTLQKRDQHIWHLTLDRNTGALGLQGHGVTFHFASRFGDELIGRDWADGYPCSCGVGSNSGLIEVGRGSRNEALLQKMNAWSKPYQRSMELQIDLNNNQKAIEHDQAVIDRIDRDRAWAAWNGSWIQGADKVRRVYQNGIDQRTADVPRLKALLARYREAAQHPWDPVEPDPTQPR